MDRRSEQANVRRLIRICALFVAVPTTTIGWALLLYPQDTSAHGAGGHAGGHPLQMTIFIALGFASAAVWFLAPWLARRFVPETEAQ